MEGKLEDGTVVDKEDEYKFTLGDGDIIQALDLSVALMEVEEVAMVYTEAPYAYGDQGRVPDIPSKANITYEVELLKVEEPVVIPQLPLNERLSTGEAKRSRGNYHYTRGEYSQAIQQYARGLEFLSLEDAAEPTPEELAELNEIKLKCFNNKGQCQLKIAAWDACISSCDEVLRIDKDNVKALYRKSLALAEKGELDNAIDILKKAAEIEPDNKQVARELSNLTNRRRT